MYLLGILLVTIVLLCSFAKIRLYWLKRSRNRRFKTPQECHNLIAGIAAPGFEPNQLNPYEARSLPNRRHLLAFGIENAFTTSDETYADEFVKMSRKMVNLSRHDWENLPAVCLRLVDDWKGGLSTDFPNGKLVPLVQALSLHAVLWAFFPSYRSRSADEEVPFDALVKLAEAINRAWIASKQKQTLINLNDNHNLQEALTAVLPNHKIFNPRETPLKLVLPGFETLWRIVLRTFLEIGYKSGLKHPRWRRVMVKYAQRPFSLEFVDRTSDKDGPSAKLLVSEALRLYPPTKSVYRAWKETDSSSAAATLTTTTTTQYIEMAADIDACHTNQNIWGPNAMQFDPVRWKKTTDQQESAFLPFGCKPFECPAKPVFGPRMIGLVVGTMLNQFEREQYELISEDGKRAVFEEGQRMDNSRDAYYGLSLVKVGSVPCNFLSSSFRR